MSQLHTKTVCCPKICGGKCGGPGCSDLSGGYNNCCAAGVAALNRSCLSTVAPCNMESSAEVIADPTCRLGVKSSNGEACCPRDACGGKCGGDGCNALPGGYHQCCYNGIAADDASCDDQAAPCLLTRAATPSPTPRVTPQPTPRPTVKATYAPPPAAADPTCALGTKSNPAAPKTHATADAVGLVAKIYRAEPPSDPYCLKGVLHPNGAQCCKAGCTTCGSSRCAYDALGKDACCSSVIAKNGRSCDYFPGPQQSIWSREAKYKMKFDSVLLYLPVQYLSWSWVKTFLDKGTGVQLVIEFIDNYSNLSDVAAGKYDGYLKKFGAFAKADGRLIYLRPLHEFNGDWYPWGIFREGNSLDAFKAAYRHVITVLRATGGNFKYQLSYNVKSANSNPTKFSDFYVGDDYLQICVSAYNMAGARYPDSRSLATILGYAYAQFESFAPSKPLCLAEMSTTSYGGDKPLWITDTWKSLAYQFTAVTTINWFLENKNVDVNVDWDLNTPADVKAWVDGYWNFKTATKPQ
ncbi:glycoside hydrolase superfamily [Tribonema minus]|uniref:Glycoside hydrolase superfamily n=1 Tax=Tribonema minus TaxID=303371 RepID=A0A835YSW1_9STRA|nr:glycoside hydrolase superfamily [Tribonema minus]